MPRKQPTDEVNAALASALGRPRTVLDVGCGTGVSGMTARLAGASVTGIEHEPALLVRARRLLDDVIEVNPDHAVEVEAALGDRTFDLVILPDALERTGDPAALVRRFARHVGPEGKLIASARNAEVWARRLGLERPEFGYTEPRRSLSREEITKLVEDAGLDILQVDSNPLLLKAARAVVSEAFDLSLRQGEESATGFRDLQVYQLYLELVRPFEVAIARLAPRLLAFQNVVIARHRPAPGPLSLTVGMLTMDEEPSIARMIEAIERVAPDAKILIVDSSVKDDTPYIAQRMGARVLRQLPPRGHGPAMELLMYEAANQGDALIYLDCDFTYPPEVIPELRRILESGVDVVNAARTRSRPAAMPLTNYLANRTFVRFARLLNGMPVSDLHSGMRAYRSSAIRAFDFDGEGDALPIDTLLWPARCGYRVVEIPIEYQERIGYSKLRKLTGTLWTFVRLAKTLRVGQGRADTYEAWRTPKG